MADVDLGTGRDDVQLRFREDEQANQSCCLPGRNPRNERECPGDARHLRGEEDEHVQNAHGENVGVKRPAVPRKRVLGEAVAVGNQRANPGAQKSEADEREGTTDTVARNGADPAERRARWGDAVPPGFVRLSVGCEPVEPLWAALRDALDG